MCGLTGSIMQIVAEGGDNGPFPETSMEQRVDNERSASVCTCVDMGGEGRRLRDNTCKMVVDVKYLIGLTQQSL